MKISADSYVVLTERMINDDNLTDLDYRILSYLVMLGNGNLYKSSIKDKFRLSEKEFNVFWDKIFDLGYLKKERNGKEGGGMSSYDYEICISGSFDVSYKSEVGVGNRNDRLKEDYKKLKELGYDIGMVQYKILFDMSKKGYKLPYGDGFKKAFLDWLSMRNNIGKPYKSEKGMIAQLEECGNFDEDFCIEVLKSGLRKGYQGLFFNRHYEEYDKRIKSKESEVGGSGVGSVDAKKGF